MSAAEGVGPGAQEALERLLPTHLMVLPKPRREREVELPMEGLTVTKAIVVPNLPFTLEIFVNFKNKIQIDWVIFLLVYTSIQCQLNCTAAERIVAAALILCAEQNMLEPYRTRVPFCCFGMTRNVKRGPESTSGWLTHLVD